MKKICLLLLVYMSSVLVLAQDTTVWTAEVTYYQSFPAWDNETGEESTVTLFSVRKSYENYIMAFNLEWIDEIQLGTLLEIKFTGYQLPDTTSGVECFLAEEILSWKIIKEAEW